MVTISIMNQKGGVGKSTSTRNLGAFFALKGYKTLLIDIDAQANLSQLCHIPPDATNTVLDIFHDKASCIYDVSENLFIIPSSVDFAGIELELVGDNHDPYLLNRVLQKLGASFDVCLIDCPPAINMVTTNALSASGWVLIPMEASFLAFNGLETMLKVISMVREGLNPDLSILGAFINKYKGNTVVTRNIVYQMKEKGIDIALFSTKVRQFEDIRKAELMKKSIFEYSKSGLAVADYRNLGHEILDKLKENQSIV